MAKYQLIIANHHELSSIYLAGHQKKKDLYAKRYNKKRI